MTSEELEHLGYKVRPTNRILPMYTITLGWSPISHPPNQIDFYLFNETNGPAMLDKLATARYIGTVYPKKNLAGQKFFRFQTLPKKFRFAFDPPVTALLKTSITKITPSYYELVLPVKKENKPVCLGAFSTKDLAWGRANRIEELGGFEEYLDTLE